MKYYPVIALKALGEVLNFALPPRCSGCGSITDASHRFCLGCWQSLRFLGEPCCERCGLPFDFDQGAGAQCGACIADPPAFDRLRAAISYGEIARKIALKLKYGGQIHVAETLARFMQRHVVSEEQSVLAPVPLHRWRMWQRGYNQSALIAASIARSSGLAYRADLIRRVRHTPPLRGMDRRQRADSVRGAFALSPGQQEFVRDRRIILVDDIYTTGATANACAKLLKASGAAQVDIICWARVVKDEHD